MKADIGVARRTVAVAVAGTQADSRMAGVDSRRRRPAQVKAAIGVTSRTAAVAVAGTQADSCKADSHRCRQP